MESTKNLHCVKGEGAVDHGTVTRWFKKFFSGWKNSNDPEMSGGPKIVDIVAVLQAIEANLAITRYYCWILNIQK